MTARASGLLMTPVEAQEASAAAIIRAARIDSSVFTDALFSYSSAPFQRRWHQFWNAPAAHVVEWAPVEHGKTQQITGWAFHRLGTDPINARILWIGAAQKTALKSTGIIKQGIEQPTPFLRAVFPELRRGRAKWTQAQFTVAGAKVTEKDCSVETAGVESQILGGRFTDIVLDDICTFETTFTQAQREKVTKWLESTVLGRLLDGGRIICLGNAWYPDDVMHALKARGFTVIHEEAYRETEEGEIVSGSVLWPEQWSIDRLGRLPDSLRADGSLSKRRDLGSVEAMRQLRCQPYSAGQGRFRMEWFDKAMELGREVTFVDRWPIPGRPAWPVFLGIDIGVQAKEGHDAWGFWAMAVDPESKTRLPLNMIEERMEGPAGIRVLKDWTARYGPSTMVENNAAQDFIRQFAKDQGIVTRAFTTGKNKADPAFGVPSLGVELEQGLWILPCGDERAQRMALKWRTQCLAYAPGQHTGDLLMASWFAREACRNDSATSSSPSAAGSMRADYTRGPRARYGGRA